MIGCYYVANEKVAWKYKYSSLNHSCYCMHYLLKMLKFVISVSLFVFVTSQEECPLNDDVVELIQSDIATNPPPGYDMESAKNTLKGNRQKQLDKDVRAAAVLQTKPYRPGLDLIIPAPIKRDPLCNSQFRTLWIGKTIWTSGGICYVLKPWWNIVFTTITYATCPRQKCRNLKWTTWLSYYRYWCVPANYKTFYIWVYCPGSKIPYKRLPLRLPQCCECQRYKVFFQFPKDFAVDGDQSLVGGEAIVKPKP